MKTNNKSIKDNKEKLEIANQIAKQSKKVSKSYESIEAGLLKGFRVLSSYIDKWLFDTKHLAVVSLLISILIYTSINFDSQTSILSPQLNSENTITNVEVFAEYNSEVFELVGLPEEVDVRLIGTASDVLSASNRDGIVIADLSGYTEGTHVIKLVPEGYGTSVEALSSLQEVTVTLKKKTTQSFKVEYDFINLDKIDSKYVLGTPKLEMDNVIVRGSSDTLASIAFIKALIDVEGKIDDFTIEAPLIAYDSKGMPINVDIVPSSISVSVDINTPSITVPIVLQTSGSLPDGLAIDDVTMDHTTIQIFAPEDVLSTITYIPVQLDLSTIQNDTEVFVPVVLPSNVSSSVSRVNLDITLGDEVTRVIENVPISYRNNIQNINNLVTSISNVDVEIIGTETNVNSITLEDIEVYFDMSNITVGIENELPLIVESNNEQSYIKLIPEFNTITLEINEETEGE